MSSVPLQGVSIALSLFVLVCLSSCKVDLLWVSQNLDTHVASLISTVFVLVFSDHADCNDDPHQS